MQNLAVQEQAVEDGEQRLEFSATGSEYFRIWIVNLLLTIVTLGIYSAWAKVRSNQYFYSSTRLAGSSFEYHGEPMAILKGRVLAVVLIGAYNLAFYLSMTAGYLMVALVAALMPLMTWKSLRFKLFNTSYRGIRFGFDGSLGQAYLHYLLLPLLAVTLVLAPWVHQRIKRFQHTQSRFGTSHFSFDAPVGKFYKVYAIMAVSTIVLSVLVGGALVVLAGLLHVLGVSQESMLTLSPLLSLPFVLLMYAPLLLMFVVLQNLIWNHTRLGEHEFRSELKMGQLAWIYFTNILGIVFTLGLFTPFAKVRAMKYRLESTTMIVNGSLDNFVAGEKEQVSATGEGVADFMDLDLSL